METTHTDFFSKTTIAAMVIAAATFGHAATGDYVYGGFDYSSAWGYTGNSTNGPAYIYGQRSYYGYYTYNYYEGHTNIKPAPSGNVQVPSYFDKHPVTSIGEYSFYDCAELTGVIVPASVSSLGEYAFCGCVSLTNAPIPIGVSVIPPYTFSGCKSLTEISIPNTVLTIETNAFSGCAGIHEIVIPNGVKRISQSAFSNCKGLERVIFPETIEEISDYAFSGCTNLIEIVLPNSVTNIGKCAFRECRKLKRVILSSGLTSLPYGVFLNCWNLTEVVFPENILSIGESAFCGCFLGEVCFPAALKTIGAKAFSGCCFWNDGQPLVLPKGLDYIGQCAFRDCYIVGLVMSSGVIDDLAFCNCEELNTVILDDGVRQIGAHAFRGCRNLGDVYISPSVGYIGEYAFCGEPGSIEDVWVNPALGENYDFYYDNFMGMDALTNVVIGGATDGIYRWGEKIYNDALYSDIGAGYLGSSCQWWESEEGLLRSDAFGTTIIGNNAFRSCTGLEALKVGDNVASIGNSAFRNCINLRDVTIGNSAITMAIPIRDTTSYLLYFTFFDTFAPLSIADSAFVGCNNIKEIHIPSRTVEIQNSAFKGCSQLNGIIFEGDAPVIGEGIFKSVAPGCIVQVTRNSTGWDVDIPGTWQGVRIEYLPETLPKLATNAAPEAVTNALASVGFEPSVAETLQDAIGGDAEKYNEFRDWAQAVKGDDGEAVGEVAVIASTNAALSWLLGAEKLFVNEPTIRIAEMNIAGNDSSAGNGDVAPIGSGAAFTLAVTVTDGANPAAVASEKVRGMFEATSDLGDWDGDAKLTLGVEEITGGSGSTLRFRVTPDSTGTNDRAFLRVKVK